MWMYIVTGYGVRYQGEPFIDYNFHTETYATEEEAKERLNEDYEGWKEDLLSDIDTDAWPLGDTKTETHYEIDDGDSCHVWACIKEA